jgi:H+-transporting ATPase
LLLIGLEVFQLDAGTLQTLIFLKMTVAGHLTIYLAPTGDNNFWKRPLPASILFVTTEITQIIGTFMAVYGVFMAPIGWALAGFVWGYSLLAFLITDQIKIFFFRFMKNGETPTNAEHPVRPHEHRVHSANQSPF